MKLCRQVIKIKITPNACVLDIEEIDTSDQEFHFNLVTGETSFGVKSDPYAFCEVIARNKSLTVQEKIAR